MLVDHLPINLLTVDQQLLDLEPVNKLLLGLVPVHQQFNLVSVDQLLLDLTQID
jgi:hypothetical protein